MKKVLKYYLFGLVILLSLNCHKGADGVFPVTKFARMEGDWELVKYEIDEINQIDSKVFFDKVFSIKPYSTRQSAKYFNYISSKNGSYLYDEYFNKSSIIVSTTDYFSPNDSIIESTQTDLNAFFYKNALPSSTYGGIWEIKKASKNILILDNDFYDNKINRIKMTFEKY